MKNGSKADNALEGVVLVGFIGLNVLLFFVSVPKENAQHFAQVTGALIVIATLVAKSLWERRGIEGANAAAQNEASVLRAQATRDLAAKVPPPGTAAAVDEAVTDQLRPDESGRMPDVGEGGDPRTAPAEPVRIPTMFPDDELRTAPAEPEPDVELDLAEMIEAARASAAIATGDDQTPTVDPTPEIPE